MAEGSRMDGQVGDKALIETLLLSSGASMTEAELTERLPALVQVREVLLQLQGDYSDRAIQLIEVSPQTWAVRTRAEYSHLCRQMLKRPLRLSRATIETLYVVAYFQPVTRGEIERIRGVKSSRNIMDVLIFQEWIIPAGRRQGPGNPLTFVTTQKFLETFNFESLDELPDINRVRSEGLLNRDIGIELPEGDGEERE